MLFSPFGIGGSVCLFTVNMSTINTFRTTVTNVSETA